MKTSSPQKGRTFL